MSGSIYHDLFKLSGFNGLAQGLGEGMDGEYVTRLTLIAHEKASAEFDAHAAALGAAGPLSHMFEYGTAGMLPSASGGRLDPMSAAARLYTHEVTGRNGRMNITYNIRPATRANPKHTTKRTGVSTQYLKHIKAYTGTRYFFHARPFVMEYGLTTHMDPSRSESGLMFVPTPGDNAPKNFVLTRKPFTVNHTSMVGNFASSWTSWWSARGTEMMIDDMGNMALEDADRGAKVVLEEMKRFPIRDLMTGKRAVRDFRTKTKNMTVRILETRRATKTRR